MKLNLNSKDQWTAKKEDCDRETQWLRYEVVIALLMSY